MKKTTSITLKKSPDEIRGTEGIKNNLSYI